LSPRMIAIIEDLSGDWRRLDERVERVTEEIEQLADVKRLPNLTPHRRPILTLASKPRASAPHSAVAMRAACGV
jgi:hypothetical protein